MKIEVGKEYITASGNIVKIIEKDFLDDDFIIKPFASNICINENIYFNKKNTYYFGNYKEDLEIS